MLANRVSESLPEKRSEQAAAALMDDMKQLYFDVAHATSETGIRSTLELCSTRTENPFAPGKASQLVE